VAVELLQTCSMRMSNLVDLRVGETIRKLGEKSRARWVIDIPGEKVKNGQPLRFVLLPESVRLLEWYLANWRDEPAGSGSNWLFPDGRGGHVLARFLSKTIAERAFRLVGVRITGHQFRHAAAELYLREDPNGIGIVAQHLGHRKLETTRAFYAREQTRVATQRYQDMFTRRRAKSTGAWKRHGGKGTRS
jgi:integrase